jgi:hypothetical protein
MVITIVLYFIICICAIIVIAEIIDYDYYSHPISTPIPGESLTQYLVMLFKWIAIAAICVILLRITKNAINTRCANL